MKQYFFNIAFIFSGLAIAQIKPNEVNVNKQKDFKDETVVVERVYEPKVEAAEKIKQTPKITGKTKEKLPVSYGLKDIEAESDFETSTINADELPIKNKNPYNNYIRGGAGNRSSFLVDGYAEYEVNETTNVGATINFYKTAGNIPNAITDSDELKLGAEGFLKLNFDNSQADIRLGGGTHQLDYYGIDNDFKQYVTNNNVGQSYKNLYISGKYNTFNHLFFDNVKAKAGFFGDKFKANEYALDLSSTLKNTEIFETDIMSGLNIGAKADVNLNLSNSKFEIDEKESYRTFNTGIKPQLTFSNESIVLNAGANIQYLNATHENLKEFYIYPAADFTLKTIPEFSLYGGITGGLIHNRLESLYTLNPYLFPEQELKTTENKLELFAGIRGDIGQNFKYDAGVKYQQLENIPFFVKRNLLNDVPYAQANSFLAIYDNGNKTSFEGRLNYIGLANLDLGTTLTLQSYKLKNLPMTFDTPAVKLSFDANYKLLNDKLILGGNLFYVGNRNASEFSTIRLNPEQLNTFKLNPYVDLNLNGSYLITDRWSAFVELRNIFNKNYKRYLDYEVQGITGLGGIMFKF